MATTNTATYEGQTFTRTGRRYSHAVVTTSAKGDPRPLIEWASTLELAQRNQRAHLNRAETVKGGGELRGHCFSREYYAQLIDSIIVPVSHR